MAIYDDIVTLMTAAQAAVAAGDHATARSKAVQAMALHSVNPDARQQEHDARFRPKEIKDFLTALDKLESTTDGIQRQKVTFAKVSA